ncbi:MAG: DUF4932 domain-containing protein [Candidatus Cloacimonadota bacterium]
MHIRLDNRLELLFTIMLLSDYEDGGLLARKDNGQAEQARAQFSKCSSHQAVIDFSKLWMAEISMDSIPYYAMSLAEDYSLNPKIDLEYLLEDVTDLETISAYTKKLKAFAEESDFDGYFLRLKTDFAPYLEKINSLLDKRPVQAILERYLGMKFPRVNIVLSTLMKPFMSLTFPGEEQTEVYSITSYPGLLLAEQNQGLERVLICSVWHELSHHVINPLSEKLFESDEMMRDKMYELFCPLNESIIWAITIRLLLAEGIITEKSVGIMMQNAINNKAPMTESMYKLLIDYESKRHLYPSISAYFPVLFEVICK